MKPTIGFIHVALMSTTQGLMIFAELHGRLMSSGLYNKSERIYVEVYGEPVHYDILSTDILSRYPKYITRYHGSDTSLCEWPTLAKLRETCEAEPDVDVWYAHTKGASFKNPFYCDFVRRSVADWRGVMCYYNFTNHVACKTALQSMDAVGHYLWTEKHRHFPGSFFPGNFWWATAKHINSLPYPTPEQQLDREWSEAWIGTRPEAKMHGFLLEFPGDPYGFFENDKTSKLSMFSGIPGSM